MNPQIPQEHIRRICNTCNREIIGKGRCDCKNPEYRLYVPLDYAQSLFEKNDALRGFANKTSEELNRLHCFQAFSGEQS